MAPLYRTTITELTTPWSDGNRRDGKTVSSLYKPSPVLSFVVFKREKPDREKRIKSFGERSPFAWR